MAKPKTLILRAPGTNCDVETAYAFQRAGGDAESLHLNRLLESPQIAANYQILCVPGGFSYGDDVAAGRIFANQIRHHLAEVMLEFRAAGKLLLGICNGFQVLIKSGLLDTDDDNGPTASLSWNDSGRYLARWVQVQADSSRCIFLSGCDQLSLPIAHAEGKFAVGDVAGMCDQTGRVFGLMPHPERFIDPTQHPQWTRLAEQREGAGLQLFRNAVRYFS